MASLSNKRNQVHSPSSKDTALNAHAKENTNSTTKHSKVGLEILDFHESWLEEMELYKDKLYTQKHNLQMLGVHNHAHTPQGCQLDSQIQHSVPVINFDTVSSNILTTKHKNNEKLAQNNKKLLSAAKQGVETANSRQPVNGVAVGGGGVVVGGGSGPIKLNNNQLLLKRNREDITNSKTNANSSKRQNNVHSHSNPHPHPQYHASPNKNGTTTTTTNGYITAIGLPIRSIKVVTRDDSNGNNMPSLPKQEKAKVLTLNGLTKTAANAIETSLYASNYLPQDQKFTATKPLYNDYSNPYGVTFSKVGDGDAKPRFDDDPCAGLDPNEFSDSESEDEYTGQPFYIDGDESECKQSRNIRQYKSDSKATESLDSERSEYYRPTCILTPSLFPNVPPYLNFSSHADKGPPMPSILHKVLKWKLSPVMPKIVKRVVLNSGFRIIKNTTDWMAIWEKHMKSPGFRTIRSHQKYNHMPGSFRIGRKDSMWRSIQTNMKKFGSKEFGFMQKTYVMPDDLENLREVWPKNAAKLTKWIVKPPASARGTGIRIVNKWSQFPKDRPLIVQKYIERPLLINDNKFDMRVYVVLTSINPLRIYMFKDGLARFASVKYSSELTSLDERCMHLTNYSINKFSQNYAKNEDFNACQGHKWTLQSLWSCLEAQGINTKKLWATLRNLVIKAIITGESGLNRMYRQNVNFRYNCFELFGFDILLDENLIPWLLEINISPSLHSELPLDLHVKGPLIQAVLNTALYQVPPKLSEKQQREILDELGMKGPLCYDKRVFTTCLTAEEIRKHNQYTSRNIEFREEYLDTILENLQPDDVRCLIMAEDEYARSKPLERVFPTPDTHIYLKYMDNPRYYNRLLDAWEHKYGHCRELGIKLLRRYCEEGYHLRVSESAMDKEPSCALTDIDMLHVRKSEDPINIPPSIDKPLPAVIICNDEVITADHKNKSSKD